MRRKPPYTHRWIATVQLRNPLTGQKWEAWSAHKTRELAERRVESIPAADAAPNRSCTRVRDGHSIVEQGCAKAAS